MAILSMEVLMADLMVEDALLKALLMCSGFGTPSDHSHDDMIGPFHPLVNVNCMVDMWYVDDGIVGYCRISFCYVFQYFPSFWSSLILLDFRFFWFL